MPTYIALVSFTDQGIRNFKDTRKRAAAVQAMAEKAGVTVRDVYWTMGAYDGVLVLEAPDDAAAAALLLNVGALGNVSTETLRAFDAAEIETVLAKAADVSKGSATRRATGGGGRGKR